MRLGVKTLWTYEFLVERLKDSCTYNVTNISTKELLLVLILYSGSISTVSTVLSADHNDE